MQLFLKESLQIAYQKGKELYNGQMDQNIKEFERFEKGMDEKILV